MSIIKTFEGWRDQARIQIVYTTRKHGSTALESNTNKSSKCALTVLDDEDDDDDDDDGDPAAPGLEQYYCATESYPWGSSEKAGNAGSFCSLGSF